MIDIANLNRALGQLEAQIIHLNQTLKDLKSTFQKLGERVNSLELYFSFWRGGVGAILLTGSFLSLVIQFLISFYK